MNYKVFCLVAVALIIGSSSSVHGQAAPNELQCSIAPVSRVNCGQPGITAQGCVDNGCCYNNQDLDAIWCFYPRPNSECELK
ncbi:putative gastrointestinal growth factor xP1 isoform 1-T1 [Anomaloglossus baeobatrachus]|uniref:putative gastrointestinal growth factor xP1 n=1 Tax=Anomaloglossus baeobatrachus TaxID=238106 RepID=UPI003F4F6BE1